MDWQSVQEACILVLGEVINQKLFFINVSAMKHKIYDLIVYTKQQCKNHPHQQCTTVYTSCCKNLSNFDLPVSLKCSPGFWLQTLEGLKNQQAHRGLCHFSIHKINRSEKVFMRLQCDGEEMQPVLGRATTQQNCWATICSAGFTSLSNSLLSSLYAAHYVSCRTVKQNQEQAGGLLEETFIFTEVLCSTWRGVAHFAALAKRQNASKATCCCVHSDSKICFVQGWNVALHLNQLLWLMCYLCKGVVSTTLAQRDK